MLLTFRVAIMPYYQDFRGWFRCCHCKEAFNPEVHTHCPDCQHGKCQDCTEMGQSPTSSPEPQQQPELEPDAESKYQDMGGSHYTQCPQVVTHHDHHRGHYGGYYQATKYIYNPALVGCWECGICESPVNPILHDWVCPNDYHSYCEDHCGIYTDNPNT